jgi:hypothetical protein
MPLVVPDSQELEILVNRLTPALTMKLYGNNKTPAHGDSAAAYTEIAGGGYAAKPLTFGNWNIAGGEPSTATYNASQMWTFTGAINAPGTIYGYFVTRDSDGQLMWAERFASAVVPFTPVNGSVVNVLPRYSCQSLF